MRIFLHTGLSKCAGTFFRSFFFPFLEKNGNIKLFLSGENNNIVDSIYQILNKEININDEIIKDIKDKINNENKDNKDIVISNGTMSTSQWNVPEIEKDFLYRSETIKKIFPDAKIILVIRHQLNLVLSQYRSAFQQRYIQDLNDFILTNNEINEIKKNDFRKGFDPYKRNKSLPWLNPTGLNLYFFMETYFKIFGKENCLILFAENLNESKKRNKEYFKIINFVNGNTDKSNLLTEKFINYFEEFGINSLKKNKSLSDESIRFIFLFEKFVSFFNFNIPYSQPKPLIKSDFILFKIINKLIKFILPFKYISWLKIRETLQNHNHLITKIIKFLFKSNNYDLEHSLKKGKVAQKFNDLELIYNDSNKKLLKFFDKSELPINFRSNL